MQQRNVKQWLEHLNQQPGGGITVVQTIRNAIMSASVLASAALVVLMGVLAAAGTLKPQGVVGAALLLLISAFLSVRTIWLLAQLSFQMQMSDRDVDLSTHEIFSALNALKYSAVFLTLALVAALIGVFANPYL